MKKITIVLTYGFLLIFGSACFADPTLTLIEKKYVSKYKLVGTKSFLDGINPINMDGTVNVVVEIPAGTIEKWEVSKSDGSIIWDFLEGSPRSIHYIGFIGNYGMVPKTLLPKHLGGDGDPLDALVIGPPVERGDVVSGKIIGKLNMLDNGEDDDKLIIIAKNSPMFSVSNIGELDSDFPGISSIIRIWFENYKRNGKITVKGFGSVSESMSVLSVAVEEYSK
jgi:inorganic pyrophosphatase